MAIDTAAKRSSAIHVGQPWRGQIPLPDATVGQGDRQAAALMYSGILAASSSTGATPGGSFTRRDTGRGFTRQAPVRCFTRDDTGRGFKGGRNP